VQRKHHRLFVVNPLLRQHGVKALASQVTKRIKQAG